MDYQENLKRLNELLNQQFQQPQGPQWHFQPGSFIYNGQPMQPLDPTLSKRKYVKSEVISFKLLNPGDSNSGDKNTKDDRQNGTES